MKEFSFTLGGGSISVLADSLEHAAQRLASHFSAFARLAGDKREAEFDAKHPNHIDYVDPEPEHTSEVVTAADVGEMPKSVIGG